MTSNRTASYVLKPSARRRKAPSLSSFAVSLVLSLVCCVGFPHFAFAAEMEAEDAQTRQQEPAPAEQNQASKANTKTKQDTAENSNSKASKNKKDNSVFKPSEEISEDFAVSFPVDI